jgi:hypothetical protein
VGSLSRDATKRHPRPGSRPVYPRKRAGKLVDVFDVFSETKFGPVAGDGRPEEDE